MLLQPPSFSRLPHISWTDTQFTTMNQYQPLPHSEAPEWSCFDWEGLDITQLDLEMDIPASTDSSIESWTHLSEWDGGISDWHTDEDFRDAACSLSSFYDPVFFSDDSSVSAERSSVDLPSR